MRRGMEPEPLFNEWNDSSGEWQPGRNDRHAVITHADGSPGSWVKVRPRMISVQVGNAGQAAGPLIEGKRLLITAI